MKAETELKLVHMSILLASIAITVYFFVSPDVKLFIQKLGSFGYLGALVAGFFFSSMLTAAPATASLFMLGNTLNPFYIALIGATGAMVADFILFTLIKYRISHHYGLFNKMRLWVYKQAFAEYIKNHRIFKHTIPLLGVLIIASPLPDELGIALLGASKYSTRKFFIVAWVMNFLGILAITYLGSVL